MLLALTVGLTVAGCGVTEKVQGGVNALKYAATMTRYLGEYATAVSAAQEDPAVQKAPVTPAAAPAYTRAAQSAAESAQGITALQPPDSVKRPHHRLVIALRNSSKALRQMASAAQHRNQQQFGRASQRLATAQQQVEQAVGDIAAGAKVDLPLPDLPDSATGGGSATTSP